MRPEDKKFFTALPDWKLMGLCIYREASGEPREGKIAIGTVILERVDHRSWDGDTIQEVILMPWQFSWTMEQAGLSYYNMSVHIAANFDEEYENNETLNECGKISRGMLQGEIPRDPVLSRAHCCQYLNPVTAKKTRDKWVKSGMKLIKSIGHHDFFIEAG